MKRVRQIIGVREVEVLRSQKILHHVPVHEIELFLVLTERAVALEVRYELELLHLEHLLLVYEANLCLGCDDDQKVASDELDGAD